MSAEDSATIDVICFVAVISLFPSYFVGLTPYRCSLQEQRVIFQSDHTQGHAPQSVGLLWMSDRPIAETSA
jgi:hypothetical protein